MPGSLEALISSLLYEGYCLYPYTPGSVKNATPTPFGIVYPPAYAARQRSTFEHLQVECILEASPGAVLDGSVRFLQASGGGHQAVERRVECSPEPLETSARLGATEFRFDAAPGGELAGRLLLSSDPIDHGAWRIRLRLENLTQVAEDVAEALDRRRALELAFLSTHPLLQVRGGRFVSPLEREGPRASAVSACRNLNTWPVLATPEDDAVLGAPIFLPDHPEIAPESQVNFFDNTEIEEALMLHVQVLSDEERAAIERQDPTVRAMLERAALASPEELFWLHGVLKPVNPPAVYRGEEHG